MTENNEVQRLNNFFAREDLNETELKIKERAVDLETRLNERRNAQANLEEQLKSLNQQYKTVQNEVVALAQQLNGVFQIVLDIVPDENVLENKFEDGKE